MEFLAENITFDSEDDQLTMVSGVVFGTTNIASFIISFVTLSYITFKLKLNIYMKIILGITVGVNIISSILNLLALILFQINGFFTIFECRLIGYSTIPLLATINMLNAISLLRYYMSHLASNARILKKWQAVIFIIAATFTSYGFAILTLIYQEYFQVKSAMTICLRETQFPSSPMMPILLFVKITIFAIIGLKCDLSLFTFMKNRIHDQNAVGSHLVPWKSAAPTDNKEENDLYIPIRASILSSVFMLVASILVAFSLIVALGSNQYVFFHWFVFSFIVVVSCGAPVAMIIFTIKSQKAGTMNEQQQQPPNELHFTE
jgi:hypothetical protein